MVVAVVVCGVVPDNDSDDDNGTYMVPNNDNGNDDHYKSAWRCLRVKVV